MMLKIMVVEDEPPILRGICNKIKKAHTNCEIVHTAYNGQAAIDYLTENPVDIVFTDINMPLISGLELLEYINQHHPQIITIILSGYQEFEYAKKALRLGAYDYLLKPLDLTEITKIIGKIIQELQQLQLCEVFQGHEIYQSSPGFTLKPPFDLISVCLGSFPTTGSYALSYWQSYWQEMDLENQLLTLLPQHTTYCLMSGKNPKERLLLLQGLSKAQLKVVTATLYDALQLQGQPCTLIHLLPQQDLETLYASYIKFSLEYPHMIIFGTAQLIDLAHRPAYTMHLIAPTAEKQLIHALEKQHLSLFKKTLLGIFDTFASQQLSQANLETLLNHIVLLCKKTHFISTDGYVVEQLLHSHLIACSDYAQLFEQTITTLAQYHTQQGTTDTQDKASLIEQIECFIQAHITEPITNQDLSEHFGLVPTYISKLFKTYKGSSPSEYMMMLRIEKAKEMLLQNPDLLSKDIAQIVGYSDPLYFSRVFKKSTGMYPSEYRKHTHV
ncbi:MAG: response regulator transcription factor [Cellulosilyticaceae bacterium]